MAIDRTKIQVVLYLESYIAHPFWPEQSIKIDVEKKSGMNRCRTEATRTAALKGQLEKEGMSLSDYNSLIKASSRAWYRVDNDDEASEIVIPRHHIAGMLVQAVKTAPKSVRGAFNADSFRHVVRLPDFPTGKFETDEVFDRYVKLEMSNQRSRQVNDVITDVTASGVIELLPEAKEDDLERLIKYALEQTGIGAARKMGYGRGVLREFSVM